ncbi:MAG: dipicolinate synthase subunit B [Clostridia bacterium]|nr:dipicolinate synthase subunit B [Clostridia bacterium]
MTGFAFCGSHCTLDSALDAAKRLIAAGEELLPIFSYTVAGTDTRFSKARDFCKRAEELCGTRGIYTIADAEPLGPARPLDYLIICPCTGNTMARLALGLCDTPVTMAAKAHLRNGKSILLCPASNDALGAGMKNLAVLAVRRGIYFTPMRQDDPKNKPFSLVTDFSLIPDAFEAMKNGTQLRPLFL